MSDLEHKLAEAHRRIEELESKHSEERWRTLFEYAPDGCYLCTLTGTFVDGNRKAEQLTGYEREELIGKNFLKLNLLSAKDIVRAGALLARNALGQATEPSEFRMRKKDGHWVTLEISTFPVKIDHRSLVLGIARDVTERKQKDEELQQYRDQLENMVQTRTADLEASNQQLQTEISERQKVENELVRLERMRAMWELSAGVSHNLNNILTGVLIPVEMLERTITDEKALKNIKMISASGRTAADLVSRLHQAIRAGDEGPLKAVQVNEVVKDVIQATQPRWQDEPEARGISISVETDLLAKCDIRGSESELFDCLINLVFNAVDAMPEGGTLHITTSGNENEVKL